MVVVVVGESTSASVPPAAAAFENSHAAGDGLTLYLACSVCRPHGGCINVAIHLQHAEQKSYHARITNTKRTGDAGERLRDFRASVRVRFEQCNVTVLSSSAQAEGDGGKQPPHLVHGQAVRDDDEEHSRPP